jgi:hypothetical protein
LRRPLWTDRCQRPPPDGIDAGHDVYIDREQRRPDDARLSCARPVDRGVTSAAPIMMPYRSILVHIDPRTHSRSRLGVGIGLCRDFAVRLVGTYLDDTPEITRSIAALLPDHIMARRLGEGATARHAAEDALRQDAGVGINRYRVPRSRGAPIEAAVAQDVVPVLTAP